MTDRPRRLILMRHAKSDWNAGVDDHARPLNARGRRDAPRMGSALVQAGWVPDLVLCSDAMRTTETWERMAGAFDDEPLLLRSRDLYLAGLGALQELLATHAPPVASTVLALGHNPGWESAAGRLAGVPLRMTTANCVLLELEPGPWSHAITRPARALHAVLRPKELDD